MKTAKQFSTLVLAVAAVALFGLFVSCERRSWASSDGEQNGTEELFKGHGGGHGGDDGHDGDGTHDGDKGHDGKDADAPGHDDPPAKGGDGDKGHGEEKKAH